MPAAFQIGKSVHPVIRITLFTRILKAWNKTANISYKLD
jgi:hypothetical protein